MELHLPRIVYSGLIKRVQSYNYRKCPDNTPSPDIRPPKFCRRDFYPGYTPSNNSSNVEVVGFAAGRA